MPRGTCAPGFRPIEGDRRGTCRSRESPPGGAGAGGVDAAGDRARRGRGVAGRQGRRPGQPVPAGPGPEHRLHRGAAGATTPPASRRRQRRERLPGGGTIYYPTSTADGTFGAVAISPGFTASPVEHRLAGAAPGLVRLRRHHHRHQHDERPARQPGRPAAGRARLPRVVAQRRRQPHRPHPPGRMGHSMGGGGTLSAARDNPALQAAIPLTGWHTTKNWSTVQVPTLVIGAQNDSVASVSSHSEPFYNSLPAEPRQGVPRAGGGQPLRPQQLQHDDRQVLGLVAQAVRRQRHPLRAVPVPQPQRLGHLGVPLDLPLRRRHDADDARPAPRPRRRRPRRSTCQWWQWWCRLGDRDPAANRSGTRGDRRASPSGPAIAASGPARAQSSPGRRPSSSEPPPWPAGYVSASSSTVGS